MQSPTASWLVTQYSCCVLLCCSQSSRGMYRSMWRRVPLRCVGTRLSHSTGILVRDNLTQSLRPLLTRNKAEISWYICGPTVYDDAFIGTYDDYIRGLGDSGAVDGDHVGGVNSSNGTHTHGNGHHGHHYLEDSLLAPFAVLLIGAILRHSTR